MRLPPPVPVRLETSDPWRSYVAPLAAAAGLRHDPRAEVVLHVTDLPDDCSPADPWVVGSRPHLTVAAVPRAVRIGPFVVPGLTACLRCVRAGRDRDSGTGRVGPPLSPGPGVDPGLLALALGWAARDVRTWRADGTPSTWSATVTVGVDLAPRSQRWARHPHCGCSWGVAV